MGWGEGFKVGPGVGSGVGVAVGACDGSKVGKEVGDGVGTKVGGLVGTGVGDGVGRGEGRGVGWLQSAKLHDTSNDTREPGRKLKIYKITGEIVTYLNVYRSSEPEDMSDRTKSRRSSSRVCNRATRPHRL